MGCQSVPITLVGVWPTPKAEPPSGKADVLLRLARDTNSDLVGYYGTDKTYGALQFKGSFEEAKAAFEALGYAYEVYPLDPDFKFRPVDQIIVSFSHKPLPSGSLLGHKIIDSYSYEDDDAAGAGFIVIEVEGPITPTLIDNLSNMSGVRWFEPNYVVTLDGH